MSRKKIKILHVFACMDRGGAEMRTVDIMRNIDRERYEFHFCTHSGLIGALDKEIISLGGFVHPCKLDYTFPWRFRSLLKEQKFEVVHSHIHYFSGYILRLASKEKVPIRVAHFRSSGDGRKNNLRRRIQRIITKHWIDCYATDILAVSEGAINSVWGVNWGLDSRCRVIYNGLDTSSYPKKSDRNAVFKEFNIPPESSLYIHVGRMNLAKNHKKLIRIFYEIVKEKGDSRLLLVGRGGNHIEKDIRLMVRDLDIENKVIFAGERYDVPRLLKSSDLLIFPSVREGLPGVVLEACATGTPILASNLSGIEEISSYFKIVKCLSLDDSDSVWANQAHEMVSQEGLEKLKKETVKDFTYSVFNIKRCINDLIEIWDRN